MISVVIPSRLRTPRLRTLEALAGQTLAADGFEVIVVGDGADAAVTALLAETEVPFHLRVVRQPHAGVGAARNRGAALAVHGSIVFLDDDMTFDDGLLEALQRALDGGADVALASIRIGGWVPDTRHSREARAWERNPRMQVTEPVPFSEVYFAAAAVRRDIFEQVGGFDETFNAPGRYGNADMDLGLRLSEAGATIRRIPEVVRTDLVTDERTLLRRRRQIGWADVELARKHPQVAEQLIDGRTKSRSHRIIATAVRRRPRLGNLAPGLLVLLRLLDTMGWERSAVADRLWRAARALRYWQGVAEASRAAWDPAVGLPRGRSA